MLIVLQRAYRGWIQGKTRLMLAWIVALGLGGLARGWPNLLGVGLCFLGASLRFWASGYLSKDDRPAVGGPYAWVRNPLYLGTYLMALGAVAATRQWWLFLFISILFAAIYHFIILDEEKKLKELFKQSYEEYCYQVPRWIPRFKPIPQEWRDRIHPDITLRYFSWALAKKNKAYEAYAAFLGIMFWLSFLGFWNSR